MFITLEGPDGSGKTSHIKALEDWLLEQGKEIFVTREPGGTSISEQIRDVIHDMKNTEMHPRTEALLYQAARAQNVEQSLKPKLAKGTVVLCDRFFDSTMAYQGYGHRSIPLDQLREIIQFATGGLKPDLTILIDLDVKVGLTRKTNQDEWNRLDAYDLAFHERVRAGFLELAKAEPERFEVIDGDDEWQVIQNKIRAAIRARLVF